MSLSNVEVLFYRFPTCDMPHFIVGVIEHFGFHCKFLFIYLGTLTTSTTYGFEFKTLIYSFLKLMGAYSYKLYNCIWHALHLCLTQNPITCSSFKTSIGFSTLSLVRLRKSFVGSHFLTMVIQHSFERDFKSKVLRVILAPLGQRSQGSCRIYGKFSNKNIIVSMS